MISLLEYKDHFKKLHLIKGGKLSLSDNISFFLKRIKENKHLNAYNFVFEDCIDQADIIQKKIIEGNAGKLAGMVVAIKDVLALKDNPLTC